jgi:hypothetical protein
MTIVSGLNPAPRLANTSKAAVLPSEFDASAVLAARAPIIAAEFKTLLSATSMAICPMAMKIVTTNGATKTNPTMPDPVSEAITLWSRDTS